MKFKHIRCCFCGALIEEDEDSYDIFVSKNHGEKLIAKSCCEHCWFDDCSLRDLEDADADEEDEDYDDRNTKRERIVVIKAPSGHNNTVLSFANYEDAYSIEKLIKNHIETYNFLTVKDLYNYCGICASGSQNLGWDKEDKPVVGKAIGGTFMTLPKMHYHHNASGV